MKYYIIAGEASGDLHGSRLISEIRNNDPGAVFRVWGGDMMEQAGGHLVKHYRDLAFMGFLEVAVNLKTILKNLNYCKKDINDFRPDLLILVDYPGFNLRMAKYASRKGFKVVYYISPQVWAWKKSRVYSIRKYVDKMLVILPFEKAFYSKYQFDVDFVGHPLMDILNEAKDSGSRETFLKKNELHDMPVIALLPGSRKQEIKRILPVMIRAAERYPGYQCVVAGAPSLDREYYRSVTGDKDVRILFGQTHDLLRHSHAALVASGTATLEAALTGTPQVVCYRGSAISYAIARRLVDVKYISLVNLIMDREVVTELIQNDLTADKLEAEMQKIIQGPRRTEMISGYHSLRERLGGPGAAARAAAIIHQLLKRG
ncbi:MAG TPA: lipid-A-disaccharide synthase [Bacteroidales bacterium]|nr:lipid-A-disaccharide synthase [Bacteroidales bacterium]HOX78351.1 lipid-A-disaccharide synthase [Bacteroidales bacterium]HPI85073.1 lipid-A-disaccharide synthase [Bacteroidales bacterium]HPM93504.1 lipid-A-disaccharide synthase [Bacteroidales bacterium]